MKPTPSQFTAPVIFAALATLAPSVAFGVRWEHDTDANWDIEDDTLDANDFQAWQSDVFARAIVGGEDMEGNGYLCGTWLPYGDIPAKTYAEIGGYLLQKLDEAADDLATQVTASAILTQLAAARTYLKDAMQAEYDAQMASR